MKATENRILGCFGVITGLVAFAANVLAVYQFLRQFSEPSSQTTIFPFIDWEVRPLTAWILIFIVGCYGFLMLSLAIFLFCDDGYYFSTKRPTLILMVITVPFYFAHFYLLFQLNGYDVFELIEVETQTGLFYGAACLLLSLISSWAVGLVGGTVYGARR